MEGETIIVLIGCWEMGHMDYMPGSSVQTWWHEPNSADGVDIRLAFRNDSDKVIKYAYFSFLAFNAVEDLQSCSIKDWTTARLECVGPVQPGSAKSEHWENIWYNKTIVKTERKTAPSERKSLFCKKGTKIGINP